jgi:hypothetical protein
VDEADVADVSEHILSKRRQHLPHPHSVTTQEQNQHQECDSLLKRLFLVIIVYAGLCFLEFVSTYLYLKHLNVQNQMLN